MSILYKPKTDTVLWDIAEERERQDAKWGEQHHKNGTDPANEKLADRAKAYNDLQAITGSGDWCGILFEEVFEAFAELDDVKLREELIQVAAVAVAWVEDIDSRV